jgi:broad specificity phosphatase PhoE
MGKVKVTNGADTFEIDGSDLNAAVKDGFKPTERIIVANSKTKESYEIDPKDVEYALKDGFTFQDIGRSSHPKSAPQPDAVPFKPMTDWLAMPQGYQPMMSDHDMKTGEAKQRIQSHLGDIDKSIHNLIYDKKKDLQGRITSEQLGIAPKEQGPINFQAQQLDQQQRHDIYVSPNEVEGFKEGMAQNPIILRQGLQQKVKDLSRTDKAASDQLKGDIYRLDRQGNPEKEKKIAENIDKIKSGEYDYDVTNGRLVKPEGFIESILTGYKQKVNAYEDYDVYRKGDKKEILDLINKRLKDDPDKALPVPEEGWLMHPLSEGAQMAGGLPLKPIIGGGIAGYLGGPQAGAAAAAAISAPEMYKLTFGSALPHNYAALKRQNPNMSEDEVLQKAIDLTHNQANIDAASGAVMGALGAKSGFGPTGLNKQLLTKSLGNALTQLGKAGAKKTLEGLGVGTIGAGGQLIKNIVSQRAGMPVDTSEGLAQQLMAGVGLTLGMHIIAKTPELLKSKTYSQLLQSVKGVPKEAISESLNSLQEAGQITPEQAQKAQKAIDDHAAIDNSIDQNLPETDRLKIGAKIKERNILKGQLEKVDEAFHPDLKERIKKLNEDIVNISKGSERGELQTLIHKEISDGNVHGFATETLRNAEEGELKGYMKEIADQAHDPNSAQTTLETFGENIVNKAKELYPKVEPITGFKTEKGSVYSIEGNKTTRNKAAREGHPDSGPQEQSLATVYLTPDEAAKAGVIYTQGVKSRQINRVGGEIHIVDELDNGQNRTTKVKFSDKPEMGLQPFEVFKDGNAHLGNKITEMSSEVGAGKVPAETVGHVEVSEHGEDTKTAAGQENGTQPSQLSETGIEEAKSLGKHLVETGKDNIVTSEVERAKLTAKEAADEAKRISGKEIPIQENKILNTWNIGEYDGKPEGSFNEQDWVSKPDEVPKGGESFNDFKNRMEQAYNYVKSLPENTHVVTHSKVMRALEALDQTGGKWTDETTTSFLNNKENTHAISERSAAPTALDETSGSSQEVGAGISESRETSISQEPGHPAEEKGNVASPKGEPEKVGITHRQMDEIAERFGLDTYEKDPEKVREWDEQAAKRLATDPNALPDLFDKLRKGQTPDHVETRMMVQYMGDLMAKIDRDPTNVELQNQFLRTKDLFNIGGRLQGKGLVARKGETPVEERLGDFIIRDREANQGAPLTEQQSEQAIKEYKEIKAAKDALEEKVKKMEEEAAKKKAEKKLQEEVKSIKKEAKKDYKSERATILKDIGEKWRKASKESLGASVVPLAKELAAIAPDVVKLVRNLVAEGVEKLPDIIKAAHAQIKEIIPQITEKDIHDIIAGEYNKKQTKSQLEEKVYEIRLQAKLINKLEALQAGVQPKNERARIKRNQEIEDLRRQIKELEGSVGKTDAEKLTSLKARYKKQIEELQRKINAGDYGPDEKSEPIKLDKEGQELKEKYIQLKVDRERRLAEQEYANRSLGKKIKDKTTEVLNVPRTLMASVDLSAPLRQGLVLTVSHPGFATKAFIESVRQAISPRRFDVWLHDLKNSDYYKNVIEPSGLYIADPNNLHLSAKEEAFMTNLAEKIPGIGKLVAGSERAYVAYLNKMRVDIFKMYSESLKDKGITPANAPEIYEGLGRFVNAATGRGELGKLESAAQVLNTAFFSPRLIASRINLLNPLWYGKLPKEVRLMALKDMAKMIGVGAVTLGLFSMIPGVTVEKDPRSTDFGKIKVGNTRYDIWGGFQQYIRLISQLLSGSEKKTSGNIVPLGNERNEHTRADKVFSFFRGKLAPVPSMAVDALSGKTAVGEPVTLTGELKEHLIPMIINDVKDAWQDGQGPMSLVYTGLPSLVGVGTTTYESKGGSSKTNRKFPSRHIKRPKH